MLLLNMVTSVTKHVGDDHPIMYGNTIACWETVVDNLGPTSLYLQLCNY